MRKYFTTPIYYVNADPHIGSAYCTLATDTLARYWRKKIGKESVFFLTGTDENSQKTVDAASKAGQDVDMYLKKMADQWEHTWKTIGVSQDDFIRTTEERHIKTVQELIRTIQDKGDIYKGMYKGLYCTGCETFLKEADLDENGHCPAHKSPPEQLEEENYFFKLSKYQKPLLEWYEKHPQWLQPTKRKNEILSFINEGLEDISVSRETATMGIEMPDDSLHKIYVWFDALINYYTVTQEQDREDFWQDVVHIVGKDITRFHCVIWPAMLMSAGISLPKQVFAHGFFTVNGEKMSKSLGNAISPLELSDKYGNDALRVGLLSSFEFGNDGDFSLEGFDQMYKTKLAGGVGNLFNRVIVLLHKFLDGKRVQGVNTAFDKAKRWEDFSKKVEEYTLKGAIDLFFATVSEANQLLNETEVWKKAKEDLEGAKIIFAELLEYLEVLTDMAEVLLPEKAVLMREMLGEKDFVGATTILYPPLEEPKKEKTASSKVPQLSFIVDEELESQGIRVKYALVRVPHIAKKQNKAFRSYLEKEIGALDVEKALQAPSIQEANRLYTEANVEGVHPAKHLLEIIQKSGKLPNINRVVDSYNIISAKYQLSFGVHDIAKIDGATRLTTTTGEEHYIPLGGSDKVVVGAGEYAFVDEKDILCRMDCKQCEKTKVTSSTRDLLVYVQGNTSVTDDQLQKALDEALKNMKHFCEATVFPS